MDERLPTSEFFRRFDTPENLDWRAEPDHIGQIPMRSNQPTATRRNAMTSASG